MVRGGFLAGPAGAAGLLAGLRRRLLGLGPFSPVGALPLAPWEGWVCWGGSLLAVPHSMREDYSTYLR